MRYTTSPDTIVKVLTAFSLAVLSAVSVALAFAFRGADAQGRAIVVGSGLLVAGVPVVTYLLTPRRISSTTARSRSSDPSVRSCSS